MYAEDISPIDRKDLDIRQFIALQKNNDVPIVKVRFSLDTTYIKRDFDLDLIIRNLTEDNLGLTERVVHYVLDHFGRLFETAWTALYYQCCSFVDSETAEHTVGEFFEEQIDFESPYYTIQLEINCDHLADREPRYCFVVSTTAEYGRWMISDDDMRIYMNGNRVCGFNTNNDDGQMLDSLEGCRMFYGQNLTEEYQKMDSDGFQYADPF